MTLCLARRSQVSASWDVVVIRSMTTAVLPKALTCHNPCEGRGNRMKLASFSTAAGPAYGCVVGEGIVALSAKFGDRAATLRDLLAKGLLGEAERLAQSTKPDFALDAISFQPVIPNPDKIICVGLNYRDHVAESGRAVTEKPALFARYAACQVGHLAP